MPTPVPLALRLEACLVGRRPLLSLDVSPRSRCFGAIEFAPPGLLCFECGAMPLHRFKDASSLGSGEEIVQPVTGDVALRPEIVQDQSNGRDVFSVYGSQISKCCDGDPSDLNRLPRAHRSWAHTGGSGGPSPHRLPEQNGAASAAGHLNAQPVPPRPG